jgi:hypothetical protein
MVDSTPTPTPEPIQLPSEMPSLREMAFNLVGAGKDVIAGAITSGVIMASDEIAKTRWDICFDCEYFIKYVSEVNHYRCSKCGCGMRVKVRLAAMKCPINKWGPVT